MTRKLFIERMEPLMLNVQYNNDRIQQLCRLYEKSIREAKSELPLEQHAERICEKHFITIEQLKMDSPADAYESKEPWKGTGASRQIYVEARAEFSKKAHADKHAFYSIAKFLGCDHTNVMHYVKHRKDGIVRDAAPVVPMKRPPAEYTNIRAYNY